ncbi:MAG TPA: alpha/beta hydrolase [Aggregatilineales bacterium]|nr:alpha/beta hydrolase [Aggregatilineales bacterium]
MPFAPINNQKIYYEDSGGDGPAVVFMHGFLFDTTMFDAQVEALAPKYRCIRFDARAFGQTEWDGKPFSLYDTAADCIGLMDMLGIKQAVIVGMSQGGYAAVRVAVKYPDRVKALVFISTYNGVDTDDVKAIYRSMRDTWRNEGPAKIIDTYSFLFLGPQAQFPELWTYWRAKWEQRTGEQLFHANNNLIDRDEIGQDQIDKITMPALVLHGANDQGIPLLLGEQLYKSLPNGKKFVSVPNASHASNVNNPQVVNEAMLEFLAEYA